jgi:hypothetical protein
MKAPSFDEQIIRDRLRSTLAGFSDLKPNLIGPGTASEWAADASADDRFRLRIGSLLLEIYHLKDDVRGYARRKGLGDKAVEDFCNRSRPIRLCIQAGKTRKHGLGGHEKNNTVLEFPVPVLSQQASQPQPDDPVVGVLMLLVDEGGQTHQADLLAAEAMRDWITFLRDQVRMDVGEWEAAWAEKALPEGVSIYKAPLPDELVRLIKAQAEERARSF